MLQTDTHSANEKEKFTINPFELFEEGYTYNTETFPSKSFSTLVLNGLLGINIPLLYGGMGWGDTSMNHELLRLLSYIGSVDLSLGRIYEGHINALLLIGEFGSENQKKRYFNEALEGKLFGVWNSELPFETLKLELHNRNLNLIGAKIFCSGASHVARPIITAETTNGKQMIIFHMDENELEEDYSYWKPLGMKASVSCRFNFSGVFVENDQLLGQANQYEMQPEFSGGAMRFASVQLGGAEAAIHATLQHLKKLERTENQDQKRRMGQLAVLMERGRLWIEGAGKAVDNKVANPSGYLHYANMFRTEARNICEEVLRLSEKSVGLQGLMAPHPLERIHRDLSVYLKQPGPDRALSEVGSYFMHNSSRR